MRQLALAYSIASIAIAFKLEKFVNDRTNTRSKGRKLNTELKNDTEMKFDPVLLPRIIAIRNIQQYRCKNE